LILIKQIRGEHRGDSDKTNQRSEHRGDSDKTIRGVNTGMIMIKQIRGVIGTHG
jgi:hypothetical protein